MRSEESKPRKAAEKFEKKFAELADLGQHGVFLRFVSGVLGRLPREYAKDGFQIKQIQPWLWTEVNQVPPEKDEAGLAEL
eukprot:9605498-Alexandrium_andersonii.AAC.1